MKTKRIQPRVLTGNIKKLDDMAKEKGMTRANFMELVSNCRIISIDEDMLFILKTFGLKTPIEIDKTKIPQLIKVTSWNTERYSVEVTKAVEDGLHEQAFRKGCRGPYAIADLLNRICINKVLFVSPDIEDIAMAMRGSNK